MPHPKRRRSPRSVAPPQAEPPWKLVQRHALAAGSLVIVCLVIAVFAQTRVFEELNFDDDQYLDAVVRQGLTWQGFVRAWTQGHVGNWHPLTTLSFMLDAELFGAWSGGYHLHNVVLHAAASVVLFLAVTKLTGRVGMSFVAAAIFAIHPLRAESVAWITERKDVLSGLFLATTLLAYAWYVASPESRARYALLLVSFTAGLLSKSMLVTLPVALLIVDWWPLRRWEFDLGDADACRQQLRPLVLEKLPMLGLSAASAIATVLSIGDVVRPISTLPFLVRASSSVVAYATYVMQLFWPVGLAPHYPYSSVGPTTWQVVASAVFVGGITVIAWLGRRSWPSLTTGWVWFLVTLAPVIGFIPSGIQLIADRYTYVSQIWLVVAVVQGLTMLLERLRVPREAVWGATAVGLFGLAAGCYLQTSVWRDSETLWRYTLSVTRDNAYAHANLGSVLMTKGEPVEAAEQARKALAIESHNIIALANLGTLLLDRGRHAEAIELYERTIEVNPKFVLGWFFLGNAFQRAGRLNDAERAWRKAVEIEPGLTAAWRNLALLLLELHDPRGALDAAEKAVATGGGEAARLTLERARQALAR